MSTIVERLSALTEEFELLRASCSTSDSARELSIAITSLEDATMRYNRFRARGLGVLKTFDFDKPSS